MRVISLTGATSVLDPVHGEYHAGPDGVFELPHPFADHLLKTAAGSFRGEADHLSQLARESFETLRDPHVALRVLSELRERMGGLEARVTELEAAQAPTGDGEPEPEPVWVGLDDDEQEFEPQDDGEGENEESEQKADGDAEEDSADEPEPERTEEPPAAKKTAARRTTAKSRA